jgi:hypothetical protein
MLGDVEFPCVLYFALTLRQETGARAVVRRNPFVRCASSPEDPTIDEAAAAARRAVR